MNRDLRHNYLVIVIDGSFFGLAMGFFSFTTVLPLFIASLTDSAFLIGLAPALHTIGWQLPQLMSVSAIRRQSRYKNLLLSATLHERCPILLMALVAFIYPYIGTALALILSFLVLIWQSIGSGISANPWQSMIAKIIPNDMRATFLGIQSAGANLFGSVSAVIAGSLIDRFSTDNLNGFGFSFLFGALAMGISLFFLSLTREKPHAPSNGSLSGYALFRASYQIIKENRQFFWFLISRMISQFGMMAFAFYIVFGVRDLSMSKTTAGVMTGIILITQMVSGILMGRMADRLNRKIVLMIGLFATVMSAITAWSAATELWLYAVFILMGIGNGIFWTIGVAMTMDFASGEELPVYIGTANTFIAPAAVLAPLLGGWLADNYGFRITFLVSAICGLAAIFFLISFVETNNSRSQ